jgi:hypothetical protein
VHFLLLLLLMLLLLMLLLLLPSLVLRRGVGGDGDGVDLGHELGQDALVDGLVPLQQSHRVELRTCHYELELGQPVAVVAGGARDVDALDVRSVQLREALCEQEQQQDR